MAKELSSVHAQFDMIDLKHVGLRVIDLKFGTENMNRITSMMRLFQTSDLVFRVLSNVPVRCKVIQNIGGYHVIQTHVSSVDIFASFQFIFERKCEKIYVFGYSAHDGFA